MTRLRGDYDTLGGGYQFRSFTPSQAREIAKARKAGVSPKALAREYGVSVRTIYRAIAMANQPSAVGRIGPWWAEFLLTDEGPIRLTPWHSALTPAEVEAFRVAP